MIKERVDDLIDILGEEYAKIENTYVIRSNQQLVKYLDNPKKWKDKQLSNRSNLKRELVITAKQQLKALNEKAEKVFLLSYKEVDNDVIEITENEIVAKDIPNDVKKQIKNIKEFNAKQVLKLANQSLKTYSKTVKIVDSLSKHEPLYDVVKRQMTKGVENGIKVTYQDGKTYSWKAYMEMNIRTTMQSELSQHQMKVGAKTNQVFVICDSFGDCAPDHAEYQGKVYYNAECQISEEEQKYIDENNILSMQEVVNGEPYLTSRPNCRHNFHSIPSSQVLNNGSDDYLEQEGLKFGNYKDSNYEALQKQRYNERQIRKWKMVAENAKKIKATTRISDFANANKANAKVAEWQKKQRDLINSHKDVLKRQYERENAKVIVNHLGVRYDYKVVDGELEKK